MEIVTPRKTKQLNGKAGELCKDNKQQNDIKISL
jgi:hypothetical protein